MKVILSRKGFDSANGKISSPIFEDGTMISFPIPSNDTDTYDSLEYCGTTYSKILSDLRYKGGARCHIDPDLDDARRVRKFPEWIPAFGQISSSASYLKNIGIKEGDMFLFFGNFHKVKLVSGSYTYCRRTGDFFCDKDLQVIWGYLQVGKIIESPKEQEQLWWHPHSCKSRTSNSTNIIFAASDKLSFDKSKPGAGLLSFDEKRVLTAKGCNKATWKVNSVYDDKHILANRKNNAKDSSQGIYYAGIWQELGLSESEECSSWAKSIIV